MKRTILLSVLSALVTTAAHAQWAVYDAAVHTQQIASTAEEMAKFVSVINNQVNQIKQLTEQINTLHHYVDLFGDPGKVLPLSAAALRGDLLKTEVGATLTDLVKAADSVASFAYDGGGLFHVVGKDFKTPGGTTVTRMTELYRAIAAVQQTTQNYLAVSKDASSRRVALKAEMAKTVESLKSAQSDAEVQKLTGILVGLNGALDSTEHEVDQATASALVQDIANRADDQRQTEAKKEQQHAEFTEAVEKYGKTFRLWSAPVAFPAP